jgi:hypothetical protein
MILMAISPRLAMRTFPCKLPLVKCKSHLEKMIVKVP